jgi:hypothetical protein
MLVIYYGPVLLAFETDNELLLKGNSSEILNSISKKEGEMVFTLKNSGIEYKLLPFYDINNSAYGVYASIRNDY